VDVWTKLDLPKPTARVLLKTVPDEDERPSPSCFSRTNVASISDYNLAIRSPREEALRNGN
jgi:hypothetical protein